MLTVIIDKRGMVETCTPETTYYGGEIVVTETYRTRLREWLRGVRGSTTVQRYVVFGSDREGMDTREFDMGHDLDQRIQDIMHDSMWVGVRNKTIFIVKE